MKQKMYRLLYKRSDFFRNLIIMSRRTSKGKMRNHEKKKSWKTQNSIVNPGYEGENNAIKI